jgi:uncharacterized membrane protein
MTWLAIAALGVWLLFQQQALDAFRRRVERLEARLRGLEAERAAPSAPAPAATAVPITEGLASPPQPSPTLADAASIPAAIETRERPPRPRINAAAWLSEHGLAWLGGGALALGGLFLAAYAAQRGMFTPGLRIAAAIAAGFIMVGAGEWMRRRMSERRRGPVPALLAGAGAATLYGAVWASDRLYGFIDISASAPLLGLISAGLLALAFVHGMRVALVALLGAYLAPVVTNGPDWGDGPLTAYLL